MSGRGAAWRRLVLAGLAAAGLLLGGIAGTGQAQQEQAPLPDPRPADIDRNGVLILVRTTLLALDQANKTGNYTVLRDLGAPGFQANSAATLAEIFASHRRDGIDLGGVAVLEPQLTLLPRIESNGMLHMAGFFPSVPTQVNFELLFAPVNRQWRLFGLSVNFSEGGPVAPDVAPEPVAETPAEPPIAPTPAIRQGTGESGTSAN